jgi:hypothetical protein
MTRSECEAAVLFQKYFNDWYLYKFHYDWDAKRRRLVEVTSPSREVSLLRYHPPILSGVIGIIEIGFLIQLNHRYPDELDMSFIGKVVLFSVPVAFVTQIAIYWFIFIAFPDQIVTGYNWMIIFNQKMRKFGFSLITLSRIKFEISCGHEILLNSNRNWSFGSV